MDRNEEDLRAARADRMHVPALPPELAAAIVRAQREARAVEKTAKHEHHRYWYVSADTMIAEGREALCIAGLALMTCGWRFVAMESPAVGEDVAGRVVVDYRLVHESGAMVEWTSSSFVIPGKGRPQDKAEMGAITENLSYTIRGLLMLPRVDEGASVETRRDADFEPRRGPRDEGRPAPERQERDEPPPSGRREAPREQPKGDEGPIDTAHLALAAELKRKIAGVGEIGGFEELAPMVDASGLPGEVLADVRATLAAAWFKFAANADDITWIVEEVVVPWKLTGDARARALAACEEAEDRVAALEERAGMKDGAKGAA